MSEEAGQADDERDELTAELAEVRKKRDELQAMNLRVTDNLRKTTEGRDSAVAQLESLRAEYLAVKEAANTNSDNAAALREQVAGLDVALRDMTARRDKASAHWVECCEDRSRHVTSLREQLAEMTTSHDNFERLRKEWRIEFDALAAKKDDLQAQLSQLLDEQEAIARMTADNCRLVVERDAARTNLRLQMAAKRVIIAERDAAERERTESRAEVVRLRAERDAARAEAEGLRADLLAHPPSYHQELAIEQKRHLELQEDYDRQEARITMLDDTINRTENALKVAQGQHIDERLKGVLAVISQLADQAQDLLP